MECNFKYASLLSKIVFVLNIVALLLHMIGFYTTYWSVYDYIDPFRKTELLRVREYEGMWKYCLQTRYMIQCHNFKNHGSKYTCARATTARAYNLCHPLSVTVCCYYMYIFVFTKFYGSFVDLLDVLDVLI